MIQLFFDGREYYQDKEIKNLKNLSEELLKRRKELDKIKLEDMIGLIHNFSQNILKKTETKNIEGIAFLSQWFRKVNLKKIIAINFEDIRILEEYVEKENKLLIAQPKGLVGHWMAGNVMTLGFFSLIQSILAKNANVMRIPKHSLPVMLELLKTLSETEYLDLKGSQILASTAVIYFSKEEEHNLELSLLCNVRMIWGGKEAIEEISSYDKKIETCEDVIFGPKYSFSIIDKDLIENNENLKKNMEKLAYDILFSEQNSCTSPHVLVCETTYQELEKIAFELKKAFDNLPSKYKKKEITMFQASNIIKTRSKYAFSDNKKVIKSEGNEWTILLDNELKLEDPVGSRTIFIKPCDDLNKIINLITPRIQTIGYAFGNNKKLTELGKKLNQKGVSRIVPLGQMNYYDLPWDGKLLLTRLVNINSLKLLTEIK